MRPSLREAEERGLGNRLPCAHGEPVRGAEFFRLTRTESRVGVGRGRDDGCIGRLEGLLALRDRVEDVPLLAHHFLRRYSERLGKKVKTFSQDAVDLLCGYRWPGNVRELENIIEQAASLSAGREISGSDIQIEVPSPSPGTAVRRSGPATRTTQQSVRVLACSADAGTRLRRARVGSLSRLARVAFRRHHSRTESPDRPGGIRIKKTCRFLQTEPLNEPE